MAKFKAAGRRKGPPPATRAQAVGCVFLLLMAFGLVFVVVFLAIKQG
ncbi:MAG TPA: hypothetical protein VER03_18960 [Bryobacteraceae bacterium]|nr:hypothetical protein [Bryobacteraceae bacterium]